MQQSNAEKEPAMRATVLLICLLVSPSAFAADTCYVDPGGQFGKITMCVSSVLAPQAGNTYGPNHLIGRAGNDNGAWCEGAAGPGIGQSITEKLERGNTARSVSITNGYARSDAAFRANSRIKTAVLETSRGYKAIVTLKDSRTPQTLNFPKSKIEWVRLTITDVYPGSHDDTCVSLFAIMLDEEAP
jgi:hypothetical protein